ncbi:MAG TPA: AIPR family protein, partial [Candidatus Acidoferrum sp.]|nr:AIPR family protein [Candidatus Acidoferrum sp.]
MAPAESIFGIDTHENVRGFLGRDEEGLKRKSTLVNLAIRRTLENNKNDFALLNSGVVIVAEQARVDDHRETVFFGGPQHHQRRPDEGRFWRATITESRPSELVRVRLDMVKPMA